MVSQEVFKIQEVFKSWNEISPGPTASVNNTSQRESDECLFNLIHFALSLVFILPLSLPLSLPLLASHRLVIYLREERREKSNRVIGKVLFYFFMGLFVYPFWEQSWLEALMQLSWSSDSVIQNGAEHLSDRPMRNVRGIDTCKCHFWGTMEIQTAAQAIPRPSLRGHPSRFYFPLFTNPFYKRNVFLTCNFILMMSCNYPLYPCVGPHFGAEHWANR